MVKLPHSTTNKGVSFHRLNRKVAIRQNFSTILLRKETRPMLIVVLLSKHLNYWPWEIYASISWNQFAWTFTINLNRFVVEDNYYSLPIHHLFGSISPFKKGNLLIFDWSPNYQLFFCIIKSILIKYTQYPLS